MPDNLPQLVHYGSNGCAECGAEQPSLTLQPPLVTCAVCRGWLPIESFEITRCALHMQGEKHHEAGDWVCNPDEPIRFDPASIPCPFCERPLEQMSASEIARVVISCEPESKTPCAARKDPLPASHEAYACRRCGIAFSVPKQ